MANCSFMWAMKGDDTRLKTSVPNSSAMSLLTHKSVLPVVITVLFVLAATLIAAAQNDRCPARGRPSVEIPFMLVGDHIYAMASVNGPGPYRFILDTGGVNLVDAGLANHLSLRITGREPGHGTGPETVETGKTTIGHLTLGRITFTKQIFYTFDFRGVGALKRYVVTLDFPGERLFLKRYKPAPPDLDTYDRSGMRIERDPAGFRVTVVSQGTPADQAGLHPGDLIVTVDGRPATSMTLPALRDELRLRPAGSVIALEIRTEGQGHSVHIVLRDLL